MRQYIWENLIKVQFELPISSCFLSKGDTSINFNKYFPCEYAFRKLGWKLSICSKSACNLVRLSFQVAVRGAGDTQLEIAISPLGSFCPPWWLDYVKIKATGYLRKMLFMMLCSKQISGIIYKRCFFSHQRQYNTFKGQKENWEFFKNQDVVSYF